MTQRIRVADEKLGILLRREQDLNRRVLEGALDINKVLAELQEIIEGKLKNILCISANLPLSDRIAAGKYDWVNSNINEKNFPTAVEKDYEVEHRIFYFNQSISFESAIAKMEKEGFKPGNISELLKLGETQPNVQREFPVVAFGSTWRNDVGNHIVPGLYRDDARLGLDLLWFGNTWSGGFCALGVRQAA